MIKYRVEFGGTIEVEADTEEQAEIIARNWIRSEDISAVVAREEEE